MWKRHLNDRINFKRKKQQHMNTYKTGTSEGRLIDVDKPNLFHDWLQGVLACWNAS